MASFSNLTANLKLNISDFAGKLKTASTQASRFGATLSGSATSAMTDLNKKTSEWGFSLKSVSRIVSGIVISQTFYQIAQSIRDATTAVWEFTSQLEYAKIAYSNLLGDTGLATELINVLKDFAAVTPFSFEDSEKSAKRLLAYGVEYKNLMYIMQGVLSAASMQGDPAKIENISRALGQIYTKGKLYQEEMRQLAEAGIPAYDILIEKLGLTQDIIGNVGNANIDAATAINALVDGMTERFSTTMYAAAKTLTGIISNIKDNAVMLFAGIFEPFTTFAKSALNELGKFLYAMREIYELKGTGGVFEALFPPELHDTLRLFAANLMAVGQSLIWLVSALSGLLKPAVNALIMVFNAFAPIITIVSNSLAWLINVVTSNEVAMRRLTMILAAAATMWVIYKARALASAAASAAIAVVSKALAGMAAILNFLVVHPFWALLIGLGGLLVGLSGGFGKLGKSISNAFKGLTKMGGVNPDSILLPESKERANDLSKFNNKLDDTASAMDGVGDSAKKAGDAAKKAAKEAKGLLAFDEVFKLNDPDETSGGGGIDGSGGIGDIGDIGGIGGLGGLGGSFMPEIPDFSSYFTDFRETFLTGLKNTWEDIGGNVKSMGLGAILGAALGGILTKSVLGAKVGAAIGAFAGWFWEDLANALGISDVGKIAMPIAGSIGLVIGNLIGGPAGAAIGAGIGVLVGWLGDEIYEGITTLDWTGIALPAGIGLGAGIGMIVGGPAGAAIGAGIGTIVGWIIDLFIDGFTNGNWKPQELGIGLGTAIGAGIGAIIGGPAGAAIGAAAGMLVGWISGLIVEKWGVITEWFSQVGTDIATWWSETTKPVAEWFSTIGNSISTWWNDNLGPVQNWFVETGQSVATWASETTTAFQTWKTETGNALSTWWTETKTGLSTWWTDTKTGLSTWWSDTKTGFSTWCSETFSGFGTWWEDTKKDFSEWKENTVKTFSDWDSITSDTLGDWWSDTKTGFNTWWSETKTGFNNWKTDTNNKLSTWWSETTSGFGTWWSNNKTGFNNWKTETTNKLGAWSAETLNKLSAWWSDTKAGFETWKTETNKKVYDWAVSTSNEYNKWVEETTQKISAWASNVKTEFENWKTETNKKVYDWAVSTSNEYNKWVEDTTKKISGWSTNVKNEFEKWKTDTLGVIGGFTLAAGKAFTDWCTQTWLDIKTWFTNNVPEIANLWKSLWKPETWSTGWSLVSSWFSNMLTDIRSWFTETGRKISTWWSNLWSDKKTNVEVNGTVYSRGVKTGHATGGIFDREHIARFAEGNKAEAVIPLENADAMRPFVNAISQGILEGLAPSLLSVANTGPATSSGLPPMYVGTLIADERGLKQLYKKFELIQVQENARRGLVL